MDTSTKTGTSHSGFGSQLWSARRSWAIESRTVQRWRVARYRRFVDLCHVQPDEAIINVGAGSGGSLERYTDTNPVVAIDLWFEQSEWLAKPNVKVTEADGTALPFANGAFPIAFSNSVIEHIPARAQPLFAAEIRRVASRYFVQTPNKWFPIEPHYQLPLFQFLPLRVRRALNRRFTLGWQPRGYWEEITLLSARDLQRLFPDAKIKRERVLGLTKSFMAVRGEDPRPPALTKSDHVAAGTKRDTTKRRLAAGCA